MTYRRTLDAYAAAEDGDLSAAEALPLSEWAHVRCAAGLSTPQTIAANHAAHVSDTAHALREALDAYGQPPLCQPIANAARALLAAIGED